MPPEHHSFANAGMLANPDLPAEYRSILNDDAAGKARLGCDDDVFTNLAIVSDVNQVVDLRSAPDSGLIEGAPIDGRIRPNLHIIFNDQSSNLRKLLVMARLAIPHVTEAIAAQHSPGMRNDAIPQLGSRVNGDVRINLALAPNCDSSPHSTASTNVAVLPDLRAFPYDCVRFHANTSRENRGRMDHGGRVHRTRSGLV